MPWHVMKSEGCPVSKPWAVMKDEPHEVVACHESEEAANKHLATLYASEPEARAAKYDHIDFKPPSGVRAEAQKGLDWRSEFGRGGTGVGIARARDLSNGVTISPETARRMKAFFDRHQSDKTGQGWSPGEKGFPSNGRIAHALWGGDAGYAWSRKLVRQMNAADEARSIAEFLEARGFCSTGQGGGIDNSCSSKDGGGGDSGGGGAGATAAASSKAMPSGTKPSSDDPNTLRWSKKGGYAGKKAIEATREKLISQGYKPAGSSDTSSSGSGSTTGGMNALVHPDGHSFTSSTSYGTTASDNYYSMELKLSASPSKPSKGGKKKRSHEMQVETRSLCLDDFSEDDAFPLLKIERRCCEQREDGPEETWLVGYAARFGATSLKMDDFYERIDPGAFGIVAERRGRKSPLETRALFNHDPNHLLGRYPSTLRMKVDEQGLRYEIKMPETRRDLVESIERGDIRGSSFSFIIAPGGESWSVEEGRSIRTVKSVAALIDVGPVTFPAYPDASVAVARRSYDEFMRGRTRRSAEVEVIRQKKAEIEKFLRERGR